MSLTFINNQPVKFIATGSYNEDDYGRGDFQYGIPVDYDENDITQVQVRISPIAGVQDAIEDPSFSLTTSPTWAASGSGALVAGMGSVGDGSTGEIYISTENSTPVGMLLQLTINVQSIFGTAYVYQDSDLITEINATGEQIFSYVSGVGDSLRIVVTDSTSYIEVTNVSLKPLPENYAMGILDADMVPVKVITYLNDAEYFTLAKDTLTITIDWTALAVSKGCYYLAITDPQTNTCAQLGLFNHTFEMDNVDEDGVTSIQGWQGDATALFKPHYAEISATTGTDNEIVTNRYQLCADVTYNVTIVAKKGNANNCSMVLTCGGDSETWSVTSLTSATFTGTIVPVGNDYVTITNDNTPGSGGTNILIIESVIIEPASVTSWDFEYITPYQYKLASFDEGDLKKIGIFNNEDGLGFVFTGSDFYPYIRAEAKFINRRYKYERKTNENDNGLMTVAFGQSRTQRILRIEHHPNYLIDFFSLIPICDHFFVDDTEFFVDSDTYEPVYDEELDHFAKSEFIVSEPQQLVRNVNSGVTQYPPSPLGMMGDPDLRSTVLTEPLTGDTVESR